VGLRAVDLALLHCQLNLGHPSIIRL